MMDRQNLKLMIKNAFASVPCPDIADVADSHHCDECRGVVAVFQSKTWQTISAAHIDANYDKLPLLFPHAYHHFLPAFLLRALDAPGGLTWEYTFYNLTPKNISADPKVAREQRWHDERTLIFTPDQLRCIIAYLEFQNTEFERLEQWLATEKVMTRKLTYWRQLLSSPD